MQFVAVTKRLFISVAGITNNTCETRNGFRNDVGPQTTVSIYFQECLERFLLKEINLWQKIIN